MKPKWLSKQDNEKVSKQKKQVSDYLISIIDVNKCIQVFIE